jgi:hypothetical protein
LRRCHTAANRSGAKVAETAEIRPIPSLLWPKNVFNLQSFFIAVQRIKSGDFQRHEQFAFCSPENDLWKILQRLLEYE